MAGGLDSAGRAAARRLSGAGDELEKELRKAYRSAARDAAAKAQARILAASSRHPGALRAEITATVTISTASRGGTVTATISSLGTRMPPGRENLPAYADGGTPKYARWRHPVFGRDRWVAQDWQSARGWFGVTLRGEREHFAAATQRAMDETAARFGR